MEINREWKRQKAVHINRYGDKIEFTRISELEFIMKGPDANNGFLRVSRNSEGDLIMLDPPGGPMIMATPGLFWSGEGEIYEKKMSNNMGDFEKEWEDLIIVGIEWKEEIKIKCLPIFSFDKLEWKKIK
jgi:hypothetical protein